ncbi:MAG: hypothetical protein RL177_825, partial [Bacteroidota bacterium]
MSIDLSRRERFASRHIGPDRSQTSTMLKTVGAASLDDLISQTIPAAIRLTQDLNLPPATDEALFLSEFKGLATKNKIFRSFIGMG